MTTSRPCRFSERLCLSALLVALATLPAGAATDDLDALLARPLSPGSLALLIPHVKDPRVEPRWRAGLADESPEVRAAAARLLLVNGVSSAARDLAKALATETDHAAAREAARALLVLGQGAVDEAVAAAAVRLQAPEIVLALAEARGRGAIGYLGQLRAVRLADAEQLRLVSALAGKDESSLDRIADAALTASDRGLWYCVLDVAHREHLGVSAGRVTSALHSSSAAIRALTWWHVALLAATDDLPKDLRLDLAPDPTLAELPPNLAFGRELAARVMTRAKPGRPAALTPGRDVPGFAARELGGPLYARLHDDEREVLGVVRSRSVRRLPRPQGPPPPDYPALRSVTDLPRGYVADVLAQTGCRPGPTAELAAAKVRYSPLRHLQELQWTATTLPPPCARAARVILAAALLPAPASAKPGDAHWIVLPMSHDFLQCLAGTPGQVEVKPEVVGKNGIVPPRKVRDARPVYPAAAFNQRRQAVVILEAGISSAGCVDRAVVRQGAGTDFDLEALKAVTGWAFTPTLLDGRPVPVEMTVTVEFRLN